MNLIIDAIYKGFALGITLCIAIGPSFFALLQTSLKNGYKSGIALAFGVFLSDAACIGLAYLGASSLFTKPENKTIIGVIGGTVLLVFGVFSFFQKKAVKDEENKEEVEIKNPSISISVIKGFFLNILNPVVILLWVGWVAFISSNKDYTRIEVGIFFSTTLATVLATDILKALGAHKIKSLLNDRILILVNKLVGLIMIGCGIVMMYRVF